MPVRAHDEVAHHRAEGGGSPIRPAYDRPHGHHDLVALHGSQLERGDVDEHVAATELARQPAPALQIERDLRRALGRRNLESCQRLRADDAVHLEAVARLKRAHRAIQCAVERERVDVLGELTRGREAAAQQANALADDTEL
jgi:hypothetical protein